MVNLPKNKIIVIAGPTASGKSKFAMMLADKLGGVIINADSMQVYKDLPILTAQPTKQDKSMYQHELYGFLEATKVFSAGEYAELASSKIKEVRAQNKIPIIVGGTGLYIKSLVYGIVELPEISQDIKDFYGNMDRSKIYELLLELDPVAAARLHPSDTHRIIRALCVKRFLGRSLYEAHEDSHRYFFDKEDFMCFTLLPERSLLYKNCNDRLDQMINLGCIEELLELYNQNPDAKVLRAVGAPQLISYINKQIDLEKSLEDAKQATRNYAKRQLTWLRNQFADSHKLELYNNEDLGNICDSSIRLLLKR